MRKLDTLLALPAALLGVVAVHAQELQWPHNLPRTAKYYPEDEAHVNREIIAQERLRWHAPAGVRKMGDDEGEKFFLHYWNFREDDEEEVSGREDSLPRPPLLPADGTPGNVSDTLLLPAIAPHVTDERFSIWHRDLDLFKRDFKCPGGTYSCSSIGADDLCCNTGETCVSTSEGIGCCPAGATCGNDVSGCQSGYTSCPNSPNGGCCIPGASCFDIGCVFQGTRTVTKTLSISTRTTGASFTTETSAGRTVTIAYPTTKISVRVTTTTVTLTEDSTPASSSLPQQCQQGFFSCPSNQGGGCCRSGQDCSKGGVCIDTTTSATARQPVRPTSASVIPQGAGTTSPSTQLQGCPTGYYMCSAVYLGGCCRVGRDCHTTSCPPQDTTTLLSNPTVYVTGNGGAAATGGGGQHCANGWYLCGAAENGGCCPSGYVCGQQTCTATLEGQKDTGKMAPSGAGVNRLGWGILGFGAVIGVAMVWL